MRFCQIAEKFCGPGPAVAAVLGQVSIHAEAGGSRHRNERTMSDAVSQVGIILNPLQTISLCHFVLVHQRLMRTAQGRRHGESNRNHDGSRWRRTAMNATAFLGSTNTGMGTDCFLRPRQQPYGVGLGTMFCAGGRGSFGMSRSMAANALVRPCRWWSQRSKSEGQQGQRSYRGCLAHTWGRAENAELFQYIVCGSNS